MNATNGTYMNRTTKDQRIAAHKTGVMQLAMIAASGFIGSLMRGFGPVTQRTGSFDHQRVSKPLTERQTATVIQRCANSLRDGKQRRSGHRPHGSRLEHYRTMRTAECNVNRWYNRMETASPGFKNRVHQSVRNKIPVLSY